MYVDKPHVGGPAGAGIADLVAAANSGGFTVSETGGQALLTAIRNLIDWIDGQQDTFGKLSQTPKLGLSNNAEIMKPFMVQVATDDRGFVTQLLKLRASLTDAQSAITTAMANYAGTDQKAAHVVGQSGPGE
ncbi:hypothetical protein V5P93_006438 [Actinokineospora auranticolor]|uniref:Uncharacterized protein n=1 Tax=Actinokineospora auranticolor TaxID=155976 RepID=A0A2S6GBN3_9PSEU|nr:hypothetical protein [Actinokineospora auranticolor]PPK61343.1 hypothetical protein CLV40_14216 [Actinokineospora auranticolor]